MSGRYLDTLPNVLGQLNITVSRNRTVILCGASGARVMDSRRIHHPNPRIMLARTTQFMGPDPGRTSTNNKKGQYDRKRKART